MLFAVWERWLNLITPSPLLLYKYSFCSDLTWFAILDGLALDPTNYSTCSFLSLNDSRDSPTVSPLCVFFFILLQFYVPFYVKKKKIDNLMCLLEFECAKRLKAHSRAIPVIGSHWSVLGLNSIGYSWNGPRISSRYLDIACGCSYCRHWLSLVWLNTLSLTKA